MRKDKLQFSSCLVQDGLEKVSDEILGSLLTQVQTVKNM